jgi:hypothetical protein
MDTTTGRYRILLDREWSLFEFGTLPRAYLQVYAFVAHLNSWADLSTGSENDGEESPIRLPQFIFKIDATSETDDEAFGTRLNYPWKGGYDSANFYAALVRNLTQSARPRLVAVQYASPGYMDLAVWSAVAATISAIVKNLAGALRELNTLYSEIYRGMRDRELLRIDVRKKQLDLSKEEQEFLLSSITRLGILMGLTEGQRRALPDFSPGVGEDQLKINELGTLKILLSFVRRAKILAKFENDGQAKF